MINETHTLRKREKKKMDSHFHGNDKKKNENGLSEQDFTDQA